MKAVLFCVGYISIWFFAGIAIQVSTLLAG
jgi:hypothetical protein